MSRRKQPAPSRLSDGLEGEGTGTGETDQASAVTKRSPVRGRHAKDRKRAAAGLNGQAGDRTRGRRQSARTRDSQRQKESQNAECENRELREDSSLPGEEGPAAYEKSGHSNGAVSPEGRDEAEHGMNGHGAASPVRAEGTSDAASPKLAHSTVRDGADDSQESDRDVSDSAAAGTSSEIVVEPSACESQLGGVGGGATAALDQGASSQRPLTGGGVVGGGAELPCQEEDDTGIIHVTEAASPRSISCSPHSEQAPLNFSGSELSRLEAGTASVSSTADSSEGHYASCSSHGMKGSEEMGLGESAMSSDRYSSQDGDTKSQDGTINGLPHATMYRRSPSPTNSSSNESTPSKNSMKRRRPFECPESLICQLCNIDFPSAHELTLHVRSHNTASSHSCKICGKKLSSTSSLDRHMLIHSGERPFTCPLCTMSFTTNGNMHRHLRTHEKGGELPPGDYVVKHDYAKPRKRVPSRRVLENMDMEWNTAVEREGSTPPKKKVVGHGAEKKSSGEKKVPVIKKISSPIVVESSSKGDVLNNNEEAMDLSVGVSSIQEVKVEGGEEKKEEELSCPLCSKTFLCRYGLQTHIEQHPNKVLECKICNATFRNQKGLRMHVHMAHRKNKPSLPKQVNCIIPMENEVSSMTELGFTEFSSPKFPLIAQLWCEKNASRLNNTDSMHACDECNNKFPCESALNLHLDKSHSKVVDTDNDQSSDSAVALVTSEDIATRDEFLAALNLKPVSPPQSPQKMASGIDVTSEGPCTPILTSILKKPSLTSPEKAKTSLLQQHLEASPLLDTNHFSNPLGAKPPTTKSSSTPMKHSPVKGSTAGSIPAPVKPEGSSSKTNEPRNEADLEPKSGDVATEMHTPSEFACQSKMTKDIASVDSEELDAAEGDGSPALEGIEEEPCDLSSPNKKKGEHVCKYCKKVFPFSSTLKVHTRSHMGLMPYKCMLCEYASADKSTLVRHMRTHSGERPYSCKVCDFAFTTKANCERHVRKRHNKSTKEEAEEVILHNPAPKHENENKYSSPCTVCKICDRDFKFFRDLQNHLRVHEKTPQKPFTCTKCQVGFSSLSNCARHIMRRHEEVKPDDVESCITVFQHSDEKNAPIIKVPTYIKEEKTDSRSATPVFNEQGEQVEPLDFSVKKNPELDSNGGTTRQRRTSIYTEDSPLDLSMPKPSLSKNFTMRTVTSVGKYRFKEAYHKFYSQTIDALMCPHCTMTFQKGSLLKTHIRSAHPAERPFRCHLCAAAFTMKANLESHVARRHTDPHQPTAPQSFIPKSATPMQFKLMAKSASSLRYTSRSSSKTAIPLISPNTPVGAAEQVKIGPSPHNSVGSDSSGELASVSKMLAAADSNHFKPFLSPPESRSPVTVPSVFQPEGDRLNSEDNQETKESMGDDALVMRDFEDENDVYEEESSHHQNIPSTIDMSMAVKDEDAGLDQYCPDDENEGQLQIVEDEKFDEQLQKNVKREGDEKKEKRGTKFESKQCCQYCGRCFPWISSLRRHILTHTGLKPYQCPQCGANFSTKSNCERHIVRRHGGARPGSLGGSVPGGQDHPFMCPECKGFKCTTRTQLQLHYEQEHPQINFADIYPEAKKVAVTSVAKVSKHLNVKSSADEPLCLSKKPGESAGDNSAPASDDLPTDLSTSQSKYTKNSKPKPFKVKLFTSSAKIASSWTEGVQTLPKASGLAKSLDSENDALQMEDGELESEMGTPQDNNVDHPESIKEEDNDEVKVTNQQDTDSEREAGTGSPSVLSLVVPSNSAAVPQAKPPPRVKRDRARFECAQCCKRFKTAITLEKHEKIHEVDHPFHCTDCKATFTTKFNCHRHMIKLHKKSKEELATWSVKEDGAGSIKNGLINGEIKTNGAILSDQELENMSNSSLHLGDSVSALGESRGGSRNATPIPSQLSEKARKRVAVSQLAKKTKCPKLDEALMSGAVLDLQGNSDKLMAVENWLNSDMELENQEVSNGYGPEEEMPSYNSSIPILTPESPTSRAGSEQSEAAGGGGGDGGGGGGGDGSARKKPAGQSQPRLYMASFLEDEDSLVARDVANPSDVFSGGQGEEKNDIISNLLGIKDSSVLDQMLESADSAARLLGVSDG